MGGDGLVPYVQHREQAGEALVLGAMYPANDIQHPRERKDVHRSGSPVLLGLPPQKDLQARRVIGVNLELQPAHVRLEPRGLLPKVGHLIGARRRSLGHECLEALCDIQAPRDLCPLVKRSEDRLIGDNGIEIPTP
jgi:hypothetical protein